MTIHFRPSPTLFIALAAATLLGACQTASQQSAQIPPYDFPKVSTEWHDDVGVVYTGTLQVGRPCTVLRRDDGSEVAIQGKPVPVRIGDRVTVSGPTAKWSLCQTLETVRADKIDVMTSAYLPAANGTAVTVAPGAVVVQPAP
ncbi:hypothetical protein BWR60_35135 [Inquilinus limosus]|uniref:Lipoprotein n=1 Tax=Inquilinus limosus TaxID=171674 RepID=A0A211YTZ1_9PROT|nr:hypothetical protein BWR60_35135 [Inquilinus limosus]